MANNKALAVHNLAIHLTSYSLRPSLAGDRGRLSL
jgi:hypothetical protein